MISELKTGPTRSADGTINTQRSGKMGETIVQNAHGDFYEAVSRGTVYIGANPSGTAVTTQAGTSATTPALTLYNPIGSGFNLVLQTVTVDFTAAPAAACGLFLAYNSPTAAAPATVTNATIQNALLSNVSTGVGQCYRVATLAAAPIACRYIGGTTGAAAIGGVQIIDKVNGEIIVGPGVALSIQSTSAASILASFSWEEVPII